MKNDFNKEIKDEDYCTYEELPSIQFKIRRIRRFVNLFTSFVFYFFNRNINYYIYRDFQKSRYNEVMNLIEEKIQGEDMILDIQKS